MDALRMAVWRRQPSPGLLFHSDRGSLKTERVFFVNYKSRDEARKDIVDYIEMFYNSRRRHSYLGYVSPREFEKMRLLEKAA